MTTLGVADGGGGDQVFQDMLSRLQHLSERLATKESESIELSTRVRFLESDLSTANCEAEAAREELQQEATRVSLLEQQLERCQEDARREGEARRRLEAGRAADDSTLGLVQAQLSAVKSGLEEREKELRELTQYYNSMLEAKVRRCCEEYWLMNLSRVSVC